MIGHSIRQPRSPIKPMLSRDTEAHCAAVFGYDMLEGFPEFNEKQMESIAAHLMSNAAFQNAVTKIVHSSTP